MNVDTWIGLIVGAGLLVYGLVWLSGGGARSGGKPSVARRARDKAEVVKIVDVLLENPTAWCVIDTETTGLGETAEVVEVAVVRGDGRVLLNTRVRPEGRRSMPAKALEVHGISMKDLKDSPTWRDVYPDLVKAMADVKVFAFNSAFDQRLVRQTCERYGVSVDALPRKWVCIMLMAAQFDGVWNERTAEYRYPKLRGDHSALGDAMAAMALLKSMTAEAAKGKP